MSSKTSKTNRKAQANSKDSKIYDQTPKMTPSKSVSASTSSDVSTPPRNMDIETYYRSKGLSYSRVRRLNRNYVNYDGPGGDASRGIVFWDSFSPPPGYTVDDLPNSESMILSQPKEEAVSPAILAAARYKIKPKPRPVLASTTSVDDFNDLINKLTKHKRAAAADLDKENAAQSAKKSSPAVSATPLGQCEPVVELSSQSNSFSSMEFPDFDDGLNDSALIRCTQAAEKEFEEEKNRENNNQFRIVDLIDPLSSGKLNPKHKITGAKRLLKEPAASTPLNCGPARRSSRSKNGTGGNNTFAVASSASSSDSVFESSAVETESTNSTSSLRRSQRTALPRTLFSKNQSESPIKSSKYKVGDFESDDEDDLFSQIDIPSVENGNGGNCKLIQRIYIDEACDQSTLIISATDESDGSHVDANFLTQILQKDMPSQTRRKPEVEDLLTQVCNADITHPSNPSKRKSPNKRLKTKYGHR